MKKTALFLSAAVAASVLTVASAYKVVRVVKTDGTLINESITTDVGYIEVIDKEVITETVNGVSFDMILVSGGTYMMGALPTDASATNSEKPRHEETVGDFYIGQTEVTQELWTAVMGTNPSTYKTGENLPVTDVSWATCNQFITKLNELTGKTFRLPTEAEWEYAARGGNKSEGYLYSGSNNISDVAWYKDNSDNTIHPVASKEPNELKLYDMSGNVTEWTSDYFRSTYDSEPGTNVAFRGGTFSNPANQLRNSSRYGAKTTYAQQDVGLRLAL